MTPMLLSQTMQMLLRLPMLPILRLGMSVGGGVRAVMSWVRGCCNVGCVRAGIARAARSGARTVPKAFGSTPFAVIVMLKEIIYSVRARSGHVLIVCRCLCISPRFAVNCATPNFTVFCCRQHLEQILHAAVIFSGSKRSTVLAGTMITRGSESSTCYSIVFACTTS